MQIDFRFHRSRGIVWVCDIANSSSYLNDNEMADDLEEFLPRLHWFSNAIVTAAGGKFIKWVGDGFLSWFETELLRHLPETSYAVIQAAYHLSNIVNVTQLDVAPKKKFRVRHGMAFEHDAHLTTITHADGHKDLDITGRVVVLAFRLATVKANHPSIVAEKSIVEGFRSQGPIKIPFRKWAVRGDDRLRYFKGEKWGTKSIYRSSETTSREPSLRTLVSKAKEFIRIAEGFPEDASFPESQFTENLVKIMLRGPQWAVQSIGDYSVFVGDMIEPMKEFVEFADSLEAERKSEGRHSS